MKHTLYTNISTLSIVKSQWQVLCFYGICYRDPTVNMNLLAPQANHRILTSLSDSPLPVLDHLCQITTPGKALRKIWKLSPITHCDVIAHVAESKPFEVSLRQCFCKFRSGIDKYGSDVQKTVVNVAWSNPFSVYCNNCVDITGMYNDELHVCYDMIMNNWCNGISGELISNVSVLRDIWLISEMEWQNGITSVYMMFFLSLMISVSTNVYLISRW